MYIKKKIIQGEKSYFENDPPFSPLLLKMKAFEEACSLIGNVWNVHIQTES